jgi:hypothetical protein
MSICWWSRQIFKITFQGFKIGDLKNTYSLLVGSIWNEAYRSHRWMPSSAREIRQQKSPNWAFFRDMKVLFI